MKKFLKAAAAALLLFTAGCAKETAAEPETAEEPAAEEEAVTVRVGSMKGPTTLGLLNMMKKAETEGANKGLYDFNIVTAADELAAGIIGGDYDIVLVPANLASVIYKKTEGGVSVIDINTLGVLYCISADESIKGIKDLAGKTVVTTGQGTTPEYSLRYLLSQYGVDCNIEFKSEAQEVVAAMKEDSSLIAVLPQPFATAATISNEELMENFSLNDEWDALNDGSRLVTGVTIVKNSFLEEHPGAVNTFLDDHFASVTDAAKDLDGTSELAAEYGIVEKAPVAKQALPKCGLASIAGDEMKEALSGYLNVLFNADPASVGGAVPGDDFYYGTK